jgi:hypothetical protein
MEEALDGELRFLPFSAAHGAGKAAGAAVDGVERVLAGGVGLLDDVLVKPIFVVVDHGVKEVLKLLLFCCKACPCNSFSTSITSRNNLLTLLYSL